MIWDTIKEFVQRGQAAQQAVDKSLWKVGDDVEPVANKDGVYVCPNCGDPGFLEGPSGGLSTNVKCMGCGYEWNANAMGFPWQLLGKAEA